MTQTAAKVLAEEAKSQRAMTNAIADQVEAFRSVLDAYQPTNEHDSRVNPKLNLQAAKAAEVMADNIEAILRGESRSPESVLAEKVN